MYIELSVVGIAMEIDIMLFRLVGQIRSKATGLDSLELRLLNCDLLCSYKVLFGKLEMDYTDMFVIRSQSATRGHSWKLFSRQ